MTDIDATKLSKTDRSKREKRRRIKDASRAMFLSVGFEESTIRDIAQMAGVAQGTLFLYASSKRDLLFMLYNDLLDAINVHSFALTTEGRPLADTLMRVAYIYYREFTDGLGIARIALVTLNLYDQSSEGERFTQIHGDFLAFLEGIFQREMDAGRLSREFSAALVTSMTCSILLEVMKHYVRSDIPDIRRAMRDTAAQLTILLRGLGADPAMQEIQAEDLRALTYSA